MGGGHRQTPESDKGFYLPPSPMECCGMAYLDGVHAVGLHCSQGTDTAEGVTPFIPSIKQSCFFCPRERHFLNPQGGSPAKTLGDGPRKERVRTLHSWHSQ